MNGKIRPIPLKELNDVLDQLIHKLGWLILSSLQEPLLQLRVIMTLNAGGLCAERKRLGVSSYR